MPHGARKQACESPLQSQILLYRNRVSKDLNFTRMFFSGEVNDGRKVQGSWKYIKITEFNEMINGKLELRKLPPEKWYKWGSLEETDRYGRRFGLIPFVEEILILCIKHPNATVEWSK